MIDTRRPFVLQYGNGKYVVKYLDTGEQKDVTKEMKKEEVKLYKQDKEREKEEKKK
jgi:hypothetical protein